MDMRNGVKMHVIDTGTYVVSCGVVWCDMI